MFMTGVVCINAVTMGLELDIPWFGWIFANNCFLTVYAFDVALRITWWRLDFFTHAADWIWNWLDLMIVSTGIMPPISTYGSLAFHGLGVL